jgi:cytochrome P450 family 142 subfamily A polypeptide 1
MASIAAQPRVNVLDPQFYVDPWDAYRWLREEAPVFWDPVQKLWVISRYDDLRAVERETETYTSFNGSRPHTVQDDDRSMINLDNPAHQQQRGLVIGRFTPRGVRSHEERVRELTTQILDEVVPLGECEAIDAIASRLPAMVIGEMLGYAPEDWEKVRYWSEQTMLQAGQTSPDGAPNFTAEAMSPVIMDWAEVTMKLITERQANPKGDLISVWTQQGWDLEHVMNEVILVLDGGAETTRTVIGSIIRELALDTASRQLLIERPELLQTTAVEEFIRWVSPISNMRRTATVDHELHGQQIRKGDEILLLYGAANRDPAAFNDPDVFDITREHNQHVAFGFGTHLCLGAHLARLEIRVMFEEMLRRMPDWELVDPGEPQIIPATFARSYDRIRIRYTPGG